MEAKHFIFPAVALLLAGVFLAGQRTRISDLRSGNSELRERMSVAHAADTRSDPGRLARADPRKEVIDWDKLVGFLRENPDGNPPGMISIQRRLLAMDAAELLAALDGIAAMDLDDATRLRLETMILDPLCKKDPEAALESFKGKLTKPPGIQTFLLTHALKDWAKKDLAAATAWMDREVADGTFDARSLDGKNPVWMRLEAVVVFGQFAADPAKAEARLSKLPPTMRAEVLGQADAFHKMGAEDEIAFAEIVRRQLDEKGRVASIAERAERVMDRGDDFAAVDEYLDSIYAAPDERERASELAAGNYARTLAMESRLRAAEIEKMRAWVGRDVPEAVGRLTGQALGAAVNLSASMDFEEASVLALRYSEDAGNDDVLQSFLSTLDPMNKAARKLVEKISDPLKRENLLRRFE